MVSYLAGVWERRHFWLALVRMDLRSRYRGSALGMGWSLLQPLAMTFLFTLIFCQIFQKDPRYYAPFVLTGLAFWTFFQQTAVQGCTCYTFSTAYIRQCPAPLAIYSLRIVLALGFHFLIALSLAIVFATILWGQCSPVALLSLPATLVLYLLMGWALATLTGLAYAYFRDARHLVEIGFQALFYMTPVFYDTDILRGAKLQMLLSLNPLVPFLQLLRKPLLHGTVPDVEVFARACLIVVVMVSAATCALARLERRLIFQL